MIIEGVTLTSFAGVSDRTVEFSPGLNIIFGENEAGKSTIFSAIEHALLTPSKLTKSRFAKEMERYRPVGGGDTIKTALRFSTPSGKYSLAKSWGAAAAVELKLPDGSLVTDDAGVTELLENLIPATPAIMKSVFLTYQSGIERVLADLKSSRGALFDLREVLRRALEGQDGYSTDRFKDRLNQEIESFYGRWDRIARGPEQGRGISNPWKQGCGRILTDWYAVEALKSDLEKITDAEDELATIAGNLEEALQEQMRVVAFLNNNEKARDFASVRGDTLREIDRVEELEERHAAAYDEWPRVLEGRNESTALLEKKKLEADELEKAREKVREYDRIKTRIEEVASKLQKAREYQETLALTKQRMKSEALVTDKAFAEVQGLADRLEWLERELSAGSLSLAVEAKKEVNLEIQKGVDDPEQISITVGEQRSFSAEGAVTIGHADFTITVGPGNADYPGLEDEYRDIKQKLSELLISLGVTSMAAAVEKHEEYQSASKEAELIERMLEATLAGESLTGLEAELSSSGGEAPEKKIEEIQEELTTAEHTIKSLENTLAEYVKTIKIYVSEYNEREAVLDLLLSEREQKKKLRKRIEDAPELPEGFDNWPSVIQSCSEYRARNDVLSRQILDLEKRKAELVTGMPDESAEETDLKHKQAAGKLNKTLARASALERILAKTNELLSEPEIEISDEMKRSFEGHLRVITGGKYAKSRFDRDLPDGLLRKDGAVLPFGQLSSGTRDGFSLALRLAMARCFIGDAGGFIIMDDPLVDMDDARRPAASSVLETYSTGVQTIVFTCHENHAALFDESCVVRLDG